jgi:hypothetical protein
MLCFIDPFGVKGLTLPLIRRFIKDRGCDCIFFFNYSKVNWHLDSGHYELHVDALFGRARAERLRALVKDLRLGVHEREAAIVAELQEALGEAGARKVPPFKFYDMQGARTSHFLFLATKHERGEEIWKRILAKESSYSEQGVPTFEFSPRIDVRKDESRQARLALGDGPIDGLKREMVARYAGRRISVRVLVSEITTGRKLLPSHVKKALIDLEQEHRLSIAHPGKRTRKSGLSDDAEIEFL